MAEFTRLCCSVSVLCAMLRQLTNPPEDIFDQLGDHVILVSYDWMQVSMSEKAVRLLVFQKDISLVLMPGDAIPSLAW